MESYEFIGSLAVTVMAVGTLIWRFETRISGVETRISGLSDRESRIEGLLQGHFLQASKKESNHRCRGPPQYTKTVIIDKNVTVVKVEV